MTGDAACTGFLQWALPRLGLRWAGYRKVRGTVCKRLRRRLRTLGLPDLDAYRAYLQATPAEWSCLDALCRIPISRFYRDRAVFDSLADDAIPALARAAQNGGRVLRCWSAGCASGEEPYTIVLLWRHRIGKEFPGVELQVVATDVEPAMLARARLGCYAFGSLKDLPKDLTPSFRRVDDHWCLSAEIRNAVDWRLQDIREAQPLEIFDFVLCRNLVFTYFEPALQSRLLQVIASHIRTGGALVIGAHERLPESDAFEPWNGRRSIFRRRPETRRST
jgi:chemotaxis protein methyltransferase CheR